MSTRRHMILQGDVVETLAEYFPENYFDACLCDPPYLLEFMGKEFDKQHKKEHGANDGQRMQRWHEKWTREVLRVLKPGAHMLAFGGTRTYHRLASAAEDVGFEVRDMLEWMYGSGFPKSLDIAKGIDKINGESERALKFTAWSPGLELSASWSGYGTTLKPAQEPILLAMKPLDGTFANNAINHRVAGLNIGSCRISGGRWPANLILSHHESCNGECHPDCPVRMLDEQSGVTRSSASGYNFEKSNNGNPSRVTTNIKSGVHFGDSGGASRFFYVSKVSPRERNLGGLDRKETVSVYSTSWEGEDLLVARLQIDADTSPPRVTGVFTIPPSDANAWNMFLFGRDATERPCLLDIASTTGTKTNSTTESKILSWLHTLITSEFTPPITREEMMGGGSNSALTARNGSKPQLSIGISREACGRIATAGLVGLGEWLMRSESVRIELEGRGNFHPTQKPISLTTYLARLLLPPPCESSPRRLLIPFSGAGSEVAGALLAGWDEVWGIEREQEYNEWAEARIDAAAYSPTSPFLHLVTATSPPVHAPSP